jgi:hypothetical protein
MEIKISCHDATSPVCFERSVIDREKPDLALLTSYAELGFPERFNVYIYRRRT